MLYVLRVIKPKREAAVVLEYTQSLRRKNIFLITLRKHDEKLTS